MCQLDVNIMEISLVLQLPIPSNGSSPPLFLLAITHVRKTASLNTFLLSTTMTHFMLSTWVTMCHVIAHTKNPVIKGGWGQAWHYPGWADFENTKPTHPSLNQWLKQSLPHSLPMSSSPITFSNLSSADNNHSSAPLCILPS